MPVLAAAPDRERDCEAVEPGDQGEHHPAVERTDPQAAERFVGRRGRGRMKVDLAQPGDQDDEEDPDVVVAQADGRRLQEGQLEGRPIEIVGHAFAPVLARADQVAPDDRDVEVFLQHAHPRSPDVEIAEAARLDAQENHHQQVGEQQGDVRVLGPSEGEGKHGAGRHHRPVGGGIEPRAPAVGAAALAAVEMNHRRDVFGAREGKILECVLRLKLRLGHRCSSRRNLGSPTKLTCRPPAVNLGGLSS